MRPPPERRRQHLELMKANIALLRSYSEAAGALPASAAAARRADRRLAARERRVRAAARAARVPDCAPG